MYLKIHNSDQDAWTLLDDFSRVEILPKTYVEVDGEFNVAGTVAAVQRHITETLGEEAVSKVRLVALSSEWLEKNVAKGKVYYQLFKCYLPHKVAGDPSVQHTAMEYYYALHNAKAFVCSDHGHTMESCVVNRVPKEELE